MDYAFITPEYQITQRKDIEVKDVILQDVKALKVETETKTFEVKREINPMTKRPYGRVRENKIDTTSETTTYELSEVTPEQLLQFRKIGLHLSY